MWLRLRQSVRLFQVVFALGWIFAAPVFADNDVIELFTSQGCSSCPPADALLGEYAGQPGLIALAYHVDYWDDLGWRDRFSVPEAAKRQRSYAERLTRSGPFTPQAVVNGERSFVGSDRRALNQAIAGKHSAIAVQLSVARGELVIALPQHSMAESVDVNVIAYLPEATTQVGSGENARRTLREFNIVRAFRRAGSWNGESRQLHVALSSLPPEASRVAVLLQRPKQGSILGADALAIR
jgi:hypothetical protein